MATLLQRFADQIINKTRNPKSLEFERLLADLDTNPELILRHGTILYRGRLVKSADESKLDSEDGFKGFNKAGSGTTPPERTSDMRANYKYIPYLYCSPDPYVAVAELRPHIGSKLSVASLCVNTELKLFDLATPLRDDTEKARFLNELGCMFSEPVDSSDSTKDYIPTQYMAEYIRELGYDGIAYNSSYMNLTRAFDKKVSNASICNFVIFNHSHVQPVSSDTYKIQNIDIEVSAISDPGKEIISPIARAMGELL